ncbi:MAG TPA: penicillin acylase family protein [Solirubrobacteraceae bacterium]
MGRRGWVVFVAAACLAAPGTADAARYDVTIARTAFGIPHIKAKDYPSLGYGYGQAIAQDNVCTIAEAYVTVNAQRSRYFGPSRTYASRGNGTNPRNDNSDFFYQRIIDRKTVEKLVAEPPPSGPRPELKQALQGYVDGWNAWLRSVGGRDGVPDATCRGKEWVRPITLMDAYRRFYSLALLASSGVAIDGIAGAQPLLGGADAIAEARKVPPGELDRRLGGLGSNAYAIGREGSQDGHGLVYGNPHFPWQGPERFYQAHLTIPGKVDVSGGSLLGVPIINIGTTRGVAWSHTVSTARRFAPYQLQLVPGSPTSYVEDGQVKRMTADKVTIQLPDGQTRTRTLWSSEHGPILTSILGLPIFPWTPLTAYAMHDSNAANFGRLMNHFFDVNHAQTVDEIDAIERKYQGIPWVNTIAADTAGNAYYADIGTMPNISKEKYGACQVALGLVTDQLQRLPVLDGSRSSCRPDGILPVSQQPVLRRADAVSNMNDSYWLTNPAQPLEGFSRIIGDERTPRTLRTRIGLIQIRERLAGTDGLPGKGFNLENLMQVGWGNRVYSGELWRDDLVRNCATAACDALRTWDLRANLDSKGFVLWNRFVDKLVSVAPVALPAPLWPYAGSFDAKNAVDTPAGLNAANPTVQLALQQAVNDLRAAGVPLDAAPREGQTVTRRGEVIPIHGGTHSSGTFNVITPQWTAGKGYREVVHGSSYVQAVHLKPGCPDVRTSVTYGESTNPSSVHSSDLTKEYSAKRWVKLPFCAKQLEADRSAMRVHTADLGPVLVTVTEARGSKRPRIVVTQMSGKAARVVVRVRRGARVVRRLSRRAATVSLSPRVARGAYRVEVSSGRRSVRVSAKQR